MYGEVTRMSVDNSNDQIAALINGLEARMDARFNEQSTQIEAVKTHLDKRINVIQDLANSNKACINKNLIEINKVTGTANVNKQDIVNLQNDYNANIEELKITNQQLKTELNSLHNTVSLQSVKLKVQRERTEDQTNRALRKTVIIRGIPEPTKEMNWDDTRKVASEALSEVTQIETKKISKIFERIHRGGNFEKQQRSLQTQPRKIHACLYDYNDIAILRKAMATHGRKSSIYIDNHYGPDTTYRRNVAVQERKKLKFNGAIHSGYVSYPAKLFVKRSQTDKNYILHHDYSNIPVPLPQEELEDFEPLFDI